MCDHTTYDTIVCGKCQVTERKSDVKEKCSVGREHGFGKKCKVTKHKGQIRHTCKKK
jgi:hypothetical protein